MNSVDQRAATDPVTVEEVMGKVRAFVTTLLHGGAESPDITFALTYVATEFGLAVAEDPGQVFPVVLSAVTSAAAEHTSQTDAPEVNTSDASNSQEGNPNGATF